MQKSTMDRWCECVGVHVCVQVIRRDFSDHLGNWIRGMHLEIASRVLYGILQSLLRPGVSICSRLLNLTSRGLLLESGTRCRPISIAKLRTVA